MNFDSKDKMRSMMFSNYSYGQTFKKCFRYYFMNLEAFIVEYSPKLKILFLDIEISHDWLKLLILF